jgi:hemin uptake protein HemP
LTIPSEFVINSISQSAVISQPEERRYRSRWHVSSRPEPGRRPRGPAAMMSAPQPRALERREPDERPCHDARLLTDGGNEAEIRLDGVRYVLRITRQGKLILTK